MFKKGQFKDKYTFLGQFHGPTIYCYALGLLNTYLDLYKDLI